jgi:hypothetical protein
MGQREEQPGMGAIETWGAALLDGCGTRRRLQALTAIGYPKAQLARRLGLTPKQFRALMRRNMITPVAAIAVRALYDRLWDQPPSGLAAVRARTYAAAVGWPPPLAWDDWPGEPYCIDDPGCGPAPCWRRSSRTTWPEKDLAADAAFIMATQGCTRAVAAARIGVSKDALDRALARTRELEQEAG